MSKKEKITKANKRKKQLLISSALTALIIAGTIGAISVTKADTKMNGIWDVLTDEQKQQIEQIKEKRQAEHEELQQAIEDGDYNKWKEIIESRPKITDYINESNFSQFSEMHQLMQSGDYDGAQEIREELALPDEMGGMSKMGMKGMHGKKGMHGMVKF